MEESIIQQMRIRTISKKRYIKKSDIDFLNELIHKSIESSNSRTYIFGGFVRDKLRNELYKDIDIMCSNQRQIFNIIRRLENSERLHEKEVIENGVYTHSILMIETPLNNIIQLDLSIQTILECDFTCNNLIIQKDGSINTRVKPPKSLKIDSFEWLQMCINDTIRGTIKWMLSPMKIGKTFKFEEISLMFKYRNRFQKLKDRGFVEGENLTNFELILPKSINDLPKNEDSEDYECSICRTCYDEHDDTVVCDCSHHFHWCCLHEWIQRSNQCPYCRQQMVFTNQKFF